MNPASTIRFRRVTATMGVAWALFAIFLSVFALVGSRHEPALPLNSQLVAGKAIVLALTTEAVQAGVEVGDRILAIDGVPLLSSLPRWRPILERGVPNRYLIQKRSGEQVEVVLSPGPPGFARQRGDVILHGGLLAVSILYLTIGAFVWWNRPDRAEAWVLMLFCSSMSMMLATAIRVDIIPWSASRMVANFPLLGAITFHLFTTYPIEPAWVVRHRRIRVLPYAGAAVLSGAVLLGDWLGLAFQQVSAVAFFYGVGLALFSIGVLATERRQATEAGVGDRADIMLFAGVVSFMPALLILLVEHFLQTPFPWYIALLWVVTFPVAVGYGILRRQLFDLRITMKSSAAYGAATLAITGVFAFAITFADALVSLFGVNVRSLQIAFLFLAVLAFDPVRNRMQRLVDQLFDRDRAQYRVAVREISEAMVSMLSLREIGDRILVALTDTMGVGKAMVLLFEDTDRVLTPTAWRGTWDEEDIATEIPSDHPIWKQLWMTREELARVDFDDEPDPEKREACWDIYDSLGVELLVPILFGVDLLGVIAVGRKLSGERLAADDRQLLRTLANQSSIAIENAKAFDEIAKLNESLEARVEERTRELRDAQNQLMQSEKLKSLGLLVAGVAHELNNPIGFVHANLQLLDEFVAKLLSAQQRGEDTEQLRGAISKLLARSREGTERVKQIVQDLRTFSRTDQAELQDVDLHDELDATLALMSARLKEGITVVRHYGDLPEVRCYPGQLNQVILNILMNSCDVLEGGGTITITTETGDLGVRVTFHDDGEGVPAEIRDRVFDPFFTTKEVGKGTGLGLSISHGIIERHGGRIAVFSEPGEGTTFVIDLPLDATPGDE